MGLFSRSKSKIKIHSKKRDGFDGWTKCPSCGEMIHGTELDKNVQCCPKCNHHHRLTLQQRLDLLADAGSFVEHFTNIYPVDSLQFVDTEKYSDRIEQAVKKTKRSDAVSVGVCTIGGKRAALAVLDFSFMGGSMGSVVGEKITCLIELALHQKLPLVIVSASGGARMQESTLSLMQMAKTSAALAQLHEAKIPYISILTHPTTGGVTASFATLGDIIVAEPGALIAFAGPRVVEQTIRQKLPPNAQKSEFLLEKGMIDCIVKRIELKNRLALFIDFLTNNPSPQDLLAKESPQRLQDLLHIARESSHVK